MSGELPALTKQQCVAIMSMKLAEVQGTGLITRTLLTVSLLNFMSMIPGRMQASVSPVKYVMIWPNRLKEVLAY